jgi:hypothetical protein
MNDVRCCGTDNCVINQDGECWCGQRWDGEKMCQTPLNHQVAVEPADEVHVQSVRDAHTR